MPPRTTTQVPQDERERKRNRVRYDTDAHRAKMREVMRRWRLDHPAEHAARRSRIRRLRASSVEPFSQAKVDAYEGCCAYCTTGVYEHMDHVVPLSKGGPHSLDNVVPACAPCNRRKHVWVPRTVLKQSR